MSKEKSAISVFQKYLTVWVILCMVIGVLIGKFLSQIPDFLSRFEYAKVSIPMAILIWLISLPFQLNDLNSSINFNTTCSKTVILKQRNNFTGSIKPNISCF